MHFDPTNQTSSSPLPAPAVGSKRLAASAADEEVRQVARRTIVQDEETERDDKLARITKEDREKLYPEIVDALLEKTYLSVRELFQEMRDHLRNEVQLERILHIMRDEQIVRREWLGWTLMKDALDHLPPPQVEKGKERAFIYLTGLARKALIKKICEDLKGKTFTVQGAHILYGDYTELQLERLLRVMRIEGRVLREGLSYRVNPDYVEPPVLEQAPPVPLELWEKLTAKQRTVTQYIADHPNTHHVQIMADLNCGYNTVARTIKALGDALHRLPKRPDNTVPLSLG